MFWIGFGIGTIVAEIVLFFTLALCYVSSRADYYSNNLKNVGDDDGDNQNLL